MIVYAFARSKVFNFFFLKKSFALDRVVVTFKAHFRRYWYSEKHFDLLTEPHEEEWSYQVERMRRYL